MKKMGKKPQFIENKGGMEDGKRENRTSFVQSSIPPSSIPPLSFLPYLPNSTLVIS
jgi:hypothetical protein